jgi:hypothetical protein
LTPPFKLNTNHNDYKSKRPCPIRDAFAKTVVTRLDMNQGNDDDNDNPSIRLKIPQVPLASSSIEGNHPIFVSRYFKRKTSFKTEVPKFNPQDYEEL